MKQVELAQQLGISKSYLSMMLSGKREIPAHLKKPLSELVHKNPIQIAPSKQGVPRSSRGGDASNLATKRSQKT